MARRRRPPRPGALTELPPLKIATQILLLQTIYYVCGTVLILFAALVAGRPFSADMVLGWKSLRGDTTVGWMLGICWMGNSFIGFVPPRFLFSLLARLVFSSEIQEQMQTGPKAGPRKHTTKLIDKPAKTASSPCYCSSPAPNSSPTSPSPCTSSTSSSSRSTPTPSPPTPSGGPCNSAARRS
jgi:hypothetical protein